MLPLTLYTEASMLSFLENTCGWPSYMYNLHPSVLFPFPPLWVSSLSLPTSDVRSTLERSPATCPTIVVVH